MKKIVVLLTMFCSLVMAAQSMAYSLSLTPHSQTVGLGGTAHVDVNLLLAPDEELFGFNFAMAFNPAVLRFDNLVFNQTQLLDYVTGFTGPDAQNPNLVTFDGALFGFAGQTSDITPLAQLSFTGIAAGNSTLDLTGSVLDFYGTAEIPLSASACASVSDGTAPIPEPSSMILIGAALSGLAFLRRKFRMSC